MTNLKSTAKKLYKRRYSSVLSQPGHCIDFEKHMLLVMAIYESVRHLSKLPGVRKVETNANLKCPHKLSDLVNQ